MTEHVDSRSGNRDRIHETAHAVAAGHDAYLQEALDSVSWERRGLLGHVLYIIWQAAVSIGLLRERAATRPDYARSPASNLAGGS